MNCLKRLVLLCASIVVTSCASVQPRLQEVQIPPERITQKGYSLVPLNEKGWLVGERNAYQLVLGKRGENPDETFAIQAIPFRLPAFNSPEEFMDIVKEGQAKDADPRRFKMTKHEVDAYPKNGANCTKSHMISEDSNAVKRSGRSGIMVLEVLTLTCQHPNLQSLGISVTYSQRYYPNQGDPAFIQKAMRVLDSVEFTAI